MNRAAVSGMLVCMEQLLTVEAQRVVQRMYDYGLSLWGDLSRDIPFFVVPTGQRRDQVRQVSGEMPSKHCCSELYKLGLVEMEQARDDGEDRRHFWLSNSGLALARTF